MLVQDQQVVVAVLAAGDCLQDGPCSSARRKSWSFARFLDGMAASRSGDFLAVREYYR